MWYAIKCTGCRVPDVMRIWQCINMIHQLIILDLEKLQSGTKLVAKKILQTALLKFHVFLI